MDSIRSLIIFVGMRPGRKAFRAGFGLAVLLCDRQTITRFL